MNRDHLWAARQLQMVMQQRHSRSCLLVQLMDQLLAQQRALQQCWQLRGKAFGHGLDLAAAVLTQRLFAHAEHVRYAIDQLLRRGVRPVHPPAPGIDELLAEIDQLQGEHGTVEIDRRARSIAITTDPVELEGILLGPFRIELQLCRLSSRSDSSVFACIALQPHPAAGSGSTTHPHVRDGSVCAGDAAAAIQQALDQGRIADAFQLVHGVLHTYNRSSPFVPLEEWEGMHCGDCGASVSSDELYYCEHCGDDVCDQCMGSCDGCGQSCCCGCLERLDDEELCPTCRRSCRRCQNPLTRPDSQRLCGRCAAQEQDQEITHERDQEPDRSLPIPPAIPLAVPPAVSPAISPT